MYVYLMISTTYIYIGVVDEFESMVLLNNDNNKLKQPLDYSAVTVV